MNFLFQRRAITVRTPDGRRFTEVDVVPYQRLDGTWTNLRVWETECAVCGQVFEVSTPIKVRRFESSKSFQRRNCPDHKGTRAKRSTAA